MNLLGIDIPPALLSGGGVAGVVGVLMWVLRRPSEDAKAAVGGFSALSDSQSNFIDRVTARLDNCERKHADCEDRCASLEQRIARLEAVEPPS